MNSLHNKIASMMLHGYASATVKELLNVFHHYEPTQNWPGSPMCKHCEGGNKVWGWVHTPPNWMIVNTTPG